MPAADEGDSCLALPAYVRTMPGSPGGKRTEAASTQSLGSSAAGTDLRTRRDRSIVLLMLLGGLRAGEVRSLRLADVDMGLRRVRVTGKGGKERIVPVDGAFFAELAAYLREERPARCASPECFVVLRGPTAGRPLTEAGLRRIFRTHRQTSGAIRVRPAEPEPNQPTSGQHRCRHRGRGDGYVPHCVWRPRHRYGLPGFRGPKESAVV